MINDGYVASFPSAQNAIDIFAGKWVSGVPSDKRCVTGGTMPLFDDPRIVWLIEQLKNDLHATDVIELGPFECGHSYMLHQAGARSIVGIEGNKQSFVKGLIIKQIFQLDRLDLRCGEIETFLREEQVPADLIVASGVLYHFHDPLQALFDITRLASNIFLWTHYVDEIEMPAGDTRRAPFHDGTTNRTVSGVTCQYHLRSYMGAENTTLFTGGVKPTSIWMAKSSIRECLETWGFGVEIVMEDPHHANGPSACFFARRAVA